MKPIKTEKSNMVFKAPVGQENTVEDLHVQEIELVDGTHVLESCWELSEKDLEIINKSKKVYLGIVGYGHPCVCIGTESLDKYAIYEKF